MPRITEPTVVEHRIAQRAAVLAAARDVLLDEDTTFGMSEIAKRSGLARSSLYSYFSSLDDIVDALVVEFFPNWSAHVRERMEAVDDLGAKVLAYVDANLELVARGDHSLMRAFAEVSTPDRHTQAAKLFHDELRGHLHRVLEEWGAESVELQAELLQAVVFRASRALEDGARLADVRGPVHQLLSAFASSGSAEPDS